MISGARRPRARCAVSDRRLAEATAACKAPSAAHRTAVGGVGSAIGDGALVAKDRAHGRASAWFGPSARYFKKATASGRWWEWAARCICEWARRRVREWAKTPILDATPKTPTPIAFTPNLFHRMGGLRKGNDGPNVFWLRSISAGNRFSCDFRLQERRLWEPDVSS